MSDADLERKRERNRLAQRRYRLNLKRRIEELEKLAAVSTPSDHSSQMIATSDHSAYESLSGGETDNSTTQFLTNTSLNTPGSISDPAPTILPPSDSSHSRSDGDFVYELQHGPTLPSWGPLDAFPLNESTEALSHKFFPRAHPNSDHRMPTLRSLAITDDYDIPDNNRPVSHRSGGPMLDADAVMSGDTLLPSRFYKGLPTPNFTELDQDEYDNMGDNNNHRRNSRTIPPKSLERQVEYVLGCVRHAGFDDIDSFISTYYTERLSEGSIARKAQSESRKRKLPQLVETIQAASQTWGRWEGNPYREMVVKCAETLLTDEFDRLSRKTYASENEMWNAMRDDKGHRSKQPSGPRIHREELQPLACEIENALKDELPNLWAITTALTRNESGRTREVLLRLVLTTMQILSGSDSHDDTTAQVTEWTSLRAFLRDSRT